jgi:hypothetical protein
MKLAKYDGLESELEDAGVEKIRENQAHFLCNSPYFLHFHWLSDMYRPVGVLS